MLWKERQKKVETVAYDSLETIADELGVFPKFYPEVYWIGKKLKFEELGLPLRYKEEFIIARKKRTSIYLFRPKVILIGGYFLEDIGEEVGHFLHLNTSNVNSLKLQEVNDFCLNAIVEMFGFFCSKLIKPTRKNYLGRYKDYLPKEPELCNNLKDRIDSIFEIDSNPYDILSEVYHQGYGLGEKLYNAYISGVVSKQKIKELFSNQFIKKDEPYTTFVELKYNMVQFMKK